MASATKTYSGDLSTAIVGKISDALENYRRAREIEKSKASPEVKTAAHKLLRNDADAGESTTKDTDLKSYIAKVFGTELDASILQTEAKVGKLSDQILFIGQGIADTQKLVINQNELMESKFDEILNLFKKKDRREEDQANKLKAGELESGMEIRDDNFGSKKDSKSASGDLSTSAVGATFGLIDLVRGISRGKGPLSKRIMNQLLKKNRFTRVLNNRFNRPYVNPRLTTSGARVTQGSNMFTRAWSKVPKFGLGGGPKISGLKGVKGGPGPLAFLTTALDFGLRKNAGQSTLQAGLGSGSSLAGATGGGALGVKIGAALGTLIAPGVGTVVGGALGGTIFSILGGMFAGKVSDDLTGVNKKAEYETGTELQPSFMNNFFEKSVVSSAMLIASAAGVTPQVNAEIRSSGLGHIPVENLNIRSDVGRISQDVSSSSGIKSNSEFIPRLPSLPGSGGNDAGNDKEPWKLFGIELPDLGITEFIGGTINAVVDIAKATRDIVWGRKDDGYWGPKWLGWKRKSEENNVVQPMTTISGSTITDLEELAFLKLVRHVEGTSSDDSYNRWFGGRTDMDMTSMSLQELYDEQTRRMNAGETTYNGLSSAAVGIGQFMDPLNQVKGMYASQGKEFDPTKIKFSKELQLQLLLHLAKEKRGIDVSKPLTIEGLNELQKEWAGLGPFHGQTDRSLEESLRLYNQFHKELELTPIEDRKVSQINNTSFDVEDSLDSFGGGPTILITNTTYVSSNDTSTFPNIPKGDGDWVKKYKLSSLAS